MRFHSARICGFTQLVFAPLNDLYFPSLDDPALHEDLALPERHQAQVLSLLLVAHVAVHLGLEVEPGGGRVIVVLGGKEFICE